MKRLLILGLVCMALLSSVAFAEDESASTDPVFSGLDTLWVMFAIVLVFFMQAGFAMVEAGLVRTKNAANVLMKNLLDFSFASLGFFIFGYAIMFGGSGPLVGTSGWLLSGWDPAAGSIPREAHWLFQAVFAGAAATIVAGGVAERMKFAAYLAYSFIICAFIYPVVGHWVWGGGWLAELGVLDFAGSTVVHGVGGVAALVGAWLVGPRFGRFRKDGSPKVIGGHSMPLVSLGVFILWFGWYGFNAGSTLGMGDPALVARIAINTTVAPALAIVVTTLISWVRYGKPDLSLALNGALAGLVGITAGCDCVSVGGAFLIGGISGVLVIFGCELLNKIRIDDPVGAFPVHGICGIWGTLAIGLFHEELGLLYGGGIGTLGTQALGVAACLGFVAVAMFIVFKIIGATIGLRVPHETELRGLDIDEHGMESYGGFQIFTTD